MNDLRNHRIYLGLLLLIWSIHVLLISSWLLHDEPLYPWDLGSHQIQSLAFHDHFFWADLDLKKLKQVAYYYPPLYHLFGGFLQHFTNRAPDTLAFTNLLYLLGIMVVTYLFGSHLFDRERGFLAAWLVSFFPGISAYSRSPFIDICLTFFVIVALYLLYILFTDLRQHQSFTVFASIIGVFLGLGLMVKWTFGFFIVGPALFLVFSNLETGTINVIRPVPEGPRVVRISAALFDVSILVTVFFCLWLIKSGEIPLFDYSSIRAEYYYHWFFLGFLFLSVIRLLVRKIIIHGPIYRVTSSLHDSPILALFLLFLFSFLTMYNWYQYSFSTLLAVAHEHFLTMGVVQDEPHFMQLSAWLYYLRVLVHDQLFLPLFLFFCWALFKLLKQKYPGWLYLFISFIVPYILFSLIQNKDYRFTLPYLPIVAIIMVCPFRSQKKAAQAGIVLLLLIALVIHGNFMAAGSNFRANIEIETDGFNIPILRQTVQFIGPPRQESFYPQRIVQYCTQYIKERSPQNPSTEMTEFEFEEPIVLVVSNDWFLEQYSLRYWALHSRSPLTISTIDGRSPLVFRQALHSGFVLTKSGPLGEQVFYGGTLVKLLQTPGNILSNRFDLLARFTLADSSTAFLWKRKPE